MSHKPMSTQPSGVITDVGEVIESNACMKLEKEDGFMQQ